MRERNRLSSGKPKLGQHFLSSPRLLERIADAACPRGTEQGSVEQIIEIGPGRGALTEQLLGRAERVVAIEMDSELAAGLRDRWPSLELVEGDALQVDWNQWGPGVLAGNLPYYIATAIISKYLNHAGPLRQAVFLIQKEVAERITAKPGNRDFGYLSVECQYFAKVEYLFSVAPGAFRPPPNVDSAVIRLTPRVAVASEDDRAFLVFASACFRQKRKTLRNNLVGLFSKERLESLSPKERLEGLSRRAEQLSVAELVELFQSLRAGAAIC